MSKPVLPEYFEKMLDEKFKAQRDEHKREFKLLSQEISEVKKDVKDVNIQIADLKKNQSYQAQYFDVVARDVKNGMESNRRNINIIRAAGIVVFVAIAPVWWAEVTTIFTELIKIFL